LRWVRLTTGDVRADNHPVPPVVGCPTIMNSTSRNSTPFAWSNIGRQPVCAPLKSPLGLPRGRLAACTSYYHRSGRPSAHQVVATPIPLPKFSGIAERRRFGTGTNSRTPRQTVVDREAGQLIRCLIGHANHHAHRCQLLPGRLWRKVFTDICLFTRTLPFFTIRTLPFFTIRAAAAAFLVLDVEKASIGTTGERSADSGRK
jgi:hypothetical protein